MCKVLHCKKKTFYHQGVGYEKHNNPADFFIDVIIKNESIMDGISASEEDMTQIKSMTKF